MRDGDNAAFGLWGLFIKGGKEKKSGPSFFFFLLTVPTLGSLQGVGN